ncbi:carboxypeptidase B [Agrilus planipennis]|uniref:Carboxypeptidase B n=1 Tax=Agrilus planipennis TaxID=224129 RepID=A0A1W4WKC4_AGRPL|nr:carboxypeptidase B [Agrilus planipennis]XP_018320906.1 carboxypeptidase B [Agrilus planipennis]XP_018320907.1 carboxypeptidase B [Agrilus planipennis]XP_018320908.1 carboxypeptidase B [Agrilus planipennis]
MENDDDLLLLQNFIYGKFHTWDEICVFLKSLAKEYPQWVNIEAIGTTFEQRSIFMVTISSSFDNADKPSIFIEAGMHAREWLAPAVVMYSIGQLVTNSLYWKLIEETRWYFVPVANPDGYAYSHTTDRLWRKTRSPTLFPYCFGIDCNRNFDSHWSEAGSSKNPCSAVYHGPEPFSEPETSAIKEIVTRNASHIKLFLSVHSYGQAIVYPWSHDTNNSDDLEDLEKIVKEVVKSMESINGNLYRYGNAYKLTNCLAGGTSFDWAKEKAGIKYSYTIELPPDNTRSLGFLAERNEILPAAKEFFDGLQTFQKCIHKEFLQNGN